MKTALIITFLISILAGCAEKKVQPKNDFIIAPGQMPNITKDKDNNLHVVYGIGDSIMYTYSSDNAQSFSAPSLISILPDAFSFAMRGPQIAATENGIVVTACTSPGNIFSFYKAKDSNWSPANKINDVDTIAKEGFTALSADGEKAFAVWLDLRGNKKNKIYGAASGDGGKTWSANKMIYTSPDTTVCECCKPSVVVKGNNVFVMFRNWLNGNRDMYVIKSSDGGASFGEAQKLGKGNWKLNGCPMDGGGLAINVNGEIQTVWRRDGKIYAAVPGMPEKEIGEGKGCTIATVNNDDIYAWVEKGAVVMINRQRQKKILGKGTGPLLQTVNNERALCVWENDKQIHGAVVEL